MSIYSEWKDLTDIERSEEEQNKFWNDYLIKKKMSMSIYLPIMMKL